MVRLLGPGTFTIAVFAAGTSSAGNWMTSDNAKTGTACNLNRFTGYLLMILK
jgi:hypothetical protein